MSLITPFYLTNINRFTELAKNFSTKILKIRVIFRVISLGGLPPFLGFSAKFLAIKLRMSFFPLYLIILLILSSLVSLFYYTKMIYRNLFLINSEPKIYNTKNFIFTNFFLYLSVAGNLLFPSLVLLT
jgi:NADH-ubiquinone oxidoreductase chain 2